MPIGKLINLPQVTSSTSFSKREEFPKTDESSTSKNYEGEAGDIKLQPEGCEATSKLRNRKQEALIEKSHPDGDHTISLDSISYESQEDSLHAMNICSAPELDTENGKEECQHHRRTVTSEPEVSNRNKVLQVLRPHENFFQSYKSVTEMLASHDSNERVLKTTFHDKRVPSKCSSTASSQTDCDELNSNSIVLKGIPKVTDKVEDLERVRALQCIIELLEQRNSTLLRDNDSKQKIIEQFAATVNRLSNHRIVVSEAEILKEICSMMKASDNPRASLKNSSSDCPASQTVLFTTTAECNQILVGSFAGWLGAYAIKNFGWNLCMAMSGGGLLIFMGSRGGFVDFNWKKIEEDCFGSYSLVAEQTTSGDGNTPSQTEDSKASSGDGGIAALKTAVIRTSPRNHILNKYPYAIGGFCAGFLTGILSTHR